MQQPLIKFRAWIIVEEPSPHSSHMTYNLGGDILGESLTGKRPDIILMQYTGLKDKNGKEIYEGDMLRQQKDAGQKMVVYWDKDAHWGVKPVGQQSLLFSQDFLWRWAKVTEVVGNIYEHEEVKP